MAFVFGIDLPIIEMMFVVILLFIAGIAFMIWQIIKVNFHIKILENTTLEIRKYEEEEVHDVHRFEMDVKSLESDEAELFMAKVVPSITKMENFVAAKLMKGMALPKVIDALKAKGAKPDLATKVVNAMAYYLDYYNKMPKKQHDAHLKMAHALKAVTPTGKSLEVVNKLGGKTIVPAGTKAASKAGGAKKK